MASFPIVIATDPTARADAATAAAAAAAASALAATKAPSVSIAYSFPAAATDIGQSIPFPFAGAKVARIQIAPKGAAGTGTLTAKQGIASGGATLLNAANFDLSTLTGSTATALTLTGTAANLLGGLGDFIEIVIDNATADHEVVVTFQVA